MQFPKSTKRKNKKPFRARSDKVSFLVTFRISDFMVESCHEAGVDDGGLV